MGVFALDEVAPTLPVGFCWIAESASVVGNVHIGAEVGVWFGAVIRGDNERITIGEGSNIQDGAVLHTDPGFPLTVGAGCTIGHRAILHGCSIGEGSLVGMGATILNGARIGRRCLVGAGALVTEGKALPEGSLIIGAPAKAARELNADEIARLARSAEHYVQNARRFAAGLAPVGEEET
jgi:carbonic anhydrase/acetyltransferase-like protein (isoleucine patch superfamily)